jgi:hypothetical protein
MNDSIELTLEQKLTIEKTNRDIDSIESVEALQKLAKDLLSLWMHQKAACIWMMKNK